MPANPLSQHTCVKLKHVKVQHAHTKLIHTEQGPEQAILILIRGLGPDTMEKTLLWDKAQWENSTAAKAAHTQTQISIVLLFQPARFFLLTLCSLAISSQHTKSLTATCIPPWGKFPQAQKRLYRVSEMPHLRPGHHVMYKQWDRDVSV